MSSVEQLTLFSDRTEVALPQTPQLSEAKSDPPSAFAPPTTQAKAGAWELKKLTKKHKMIVQLKLEGLPRVDVAKLAKCTPEYVSMLCQQPLVREYMAERQRQLDEDLVDLNGLAVNALRRTLNSADDRVSLTAATTVLKMNGKLLQTPAETGATAEDVVSKLFQIHNANIAVQINTTGATHER